MRSAVVSFSPESRHQAFSACHVRVVRLAEFLLHHPLLAPNPQCEQKRERDEIRRPDQPVRDDEYLPERVQEERQIHRMPDTTIDATTDETVPLAHLE